MSTEVGSAYVTLLPSMRGFAAKAQAELNTTGLGKTFGRKIEGEVAATGTRAGTLFGRRFKVAADSAGLPRVFEASFIRNLRTYGYALSAIGSITVGFGLKTASSMQQAMVAFTTMLGSARKAKAFLGQLVQFAKTTPFDLPGVVQASQKLLAFGFTARQVPSMLTAIGDAAAGLSLGTEGLDRITTAIGQISAKGRLQSDELLQLTEAGIPALRILANTWGITTSNLQKYVQKGLVPASKAIPALLNGLENGTKGVAGETAKFGGLMDKQSRTLGGIFSNLKDTVSQGLATAVRPLVPALSRGMNAVMAKLPGLFRAAAHGMRDFLTGLGVMADQTPGASSAMETFGRVVHDIVGTLRATFSFIRRNAGVFKTLAVLAIGGMVAFRAFKVALAGFGIIRTVISQVRSLAIAMGLLDGAMDANPIGLIVVALGALAAALVYAYKKSETFRRIVRFTFVTIATDAGKLGQFVITVFRSILDTWFTVVGGILTGAAKAFGWVPKVGGKLKTASAAFNGFRSDVDGILTNLANDAGSLGAAAGDLFVTNFNAALDNVSLDKAAQRRAGRAAQGATKPVAKAVTSPYKAVGFGAGTALGNGIGDGLKKSGSKVAQSATSLIDKILGPLKSLKQKAQELAQSITQAITGATGFGALQPQTDILGAPMPQTLTSIIKGLTDQKLAVLKFRKELRTLEKRGLSEAAIQEIASEGVDQGGSIAATLMNATRAQLRQISQTRSATNSAARGIGVDVARGQFGARIGQELVRTMRAVNKAQQNTSLSPKTVKALKSAWEEAAKSVRIYANIKDADVRNGKRILAHG